MNQKRFLCINKNYFFQMDKYKLWYLYNLFQMKHLCFLRLKGSHIYYTLDENDIGAPKMRNIYWCNYLYCSQYSYRSFNFKIANVVDLNIFASFFVLGLYIDSWLLFYFALYSYPPSNYCSLAIKGDSEK